MNFTIDDHVFTATRLPDIQATRQLNGQEVKTTAAYWEIIGLKLSEPDGQRRIAVIDPTYTLQDRRVTYNLAGCQTQEGSWCDSCEPCLAAITKLFEEHYHRLNP